MEFTVNNFWTVCEKLRIAAGDSATALSRALFPTLLPNTYAARRKVNSSSPSLLLSALAYYGVSAIVIRRFIYTGQRFEAYIPVDIQYMKTLTMLIESVLFLGSDKPLSSIPQTIRGNTAYNKSRSGCTIYTLEKAFKGLDNVTVDMYIGEIPIELEENSYEI